MMKNNQILLTCSISAYDVVESFRQLTHEDQISIISCIDLDNADCGFTTDLVVTLLESLKKEFTDKATVEKFEDFCKWLKEVEE